MIKIIKGNFGRKVNGYIKVVTPNDPPFEATKEVEDRLVKQGVAKYVDTKKEDKKQDLNKNKNFGLNEDGSFNPETAKKLNVAELKELAKKFGIEDSEMFKDDGTNKTKADIIALIESKVKDDDGEGKGEDQDDDEEDKGEDQDDDGNDSINLGDGTEGVA